MKRQRAWKGAVSGGSQRRLTVTGYCFGSQALVELRILDDGTRRSELIDLSLRQAREAVRLLIAAIAAAEPLARHDGPYSPGQEDRVFPAEDEQDGQGTAA